MLLKRSLKIFVFFAGLFMLLYIINWRMDKNTISQYKLRYNDLINVKDSSDLIIMGASQLVHGINPFYLEDAKLKVYNYAYNGADARFQLKWYKNIFKVYHKSPRFVILDVGKLTFDSSWNWRIFEQDSKFFPNSYFYSQLFGKSLSYQEKLMMLLNRFDIIREKEHPECIFIKISEKEFDNKKYYKGFVPYLLNVQCVDYKANIS